MQGVPYINSARFTYAKVMWTLLLLAAVGVMTLHLQYLCSQFFVWPKITKITLNFSNLELPEVTICNNNVIKKSKLSMASKQLQNFVRGLDPAVLGIVQRKKRFIKQLDTFNFSIYEDYDFRDEYADTDGFGPESETSEVENTFKDLFMNHNRATRVEMGHNLTDMLLSCSFNGRVCYSENFTLYTTADYGNCYTLPSRKLVSRNSGPSSGLQMILYMENEEYLDGITQGYGARISLKDKNQIPFPTDDGFFVSSYSESDIGLKLVQIERKGLPYGTCEDGEAFKSRYGRTYSRQGCQKMWEQGYIINKCKCFNEEYAEIYRVATIPNLRPCRTKDEKKCLAKYEQEIKNKNTSPSCDNPCNENQYVRQLSSRQWPTEAYSNFLLQGVCEDQPQRCATLRGKAKDQLSLNFVKVNIYYEDLNYEKIAEDAEIENAQFLSDVGGAIGLWIGLSMLSLFEVVQLCVELCAFACHKCKKSGEIEEKRRAKQKAKKQKEGINQEQNKAVHQIEFGYHNDNYDHIKRDGGFKENMYNYSGPPSQRSHEYPQRSQGYPQRSHEYQAVDDYYIYKGPQRI